MKQNLTLFALALVLTFSVTGCTKDKAPNVTPTPTPAETGTPGPTTDPMPSSTVTPEPDATPAADGVKNSAAGTAIRPATPNGSAARNGMYGADNHGVVSDGANQAGNALKSGADRVGDVARGAVDGVGDAVKGVGQGMEDLGNGIRNATR